MTDQRVLFFKDLKPTRLDKYLSLMLPELSRSRVQRLIEGEKISVDGEIITKKSFILDKAGQEILIIIPDPDPINIHPEKLPLDIIFEDNDVIVVNKPAGMVMHPAPGHSSGTLVHAALGYDEFLQGIGGKMRPGIVHRLDKDTSGVVLIAKNDHTHKWLQKQFKDRATEKFYIALVEKHPPTSTGKIEAPIYRDPKNRKKMCIAPVGKGKDAVTIFRTIEAFNRFTLLEVQILTGRTHQIRVHLSSLGCPVVGDTIYGYSTPSLKTDRHFLHAKSISIRLPGCEEKTCFIADLPEELTEILKNLER